MINHIVMIKLKKFSGNEKNTRLNQLKTKLDSLKSIIKVIKYLETGLNISNSTNAYDLVLVTSFENLEDLDIYRQHPAHQEVLDYINIVKSDIKVVDYRK